MSHCTCNCYCIGPPSYRCDFCESLVSTNDKLREVLEESLRLVRKAVEKEGMNSTVTINYLLPAQRLLERRVR